MCYCLQTYEQLTLRKRLEARVVELGLVPRLVKRISNPSAEGLLSPEEVGLIQSDLAEFLQCKGCRCTKTVEPHQPFLLDCWDAVARLCQDQDLNLPSQLKAGVPTGVVEPMQPSGVWDARVQEDTGQDDLNPSILQVHEVPWKSVPLPAHKPHLNRFCPEISFLGACAKSINYVLSLTIL